MFKSSPSIAKKPSKKQKNLLRKTSGHFLHLLIPNGNFIVNLLQNISPGMSLLIRMALSGTQNRD